MTVGRVGLLTGTAEQAKDEGVRQKSIAAAYAPDLAEALLKYCQWLAKTRPGFHPALVGSPKIFAASRMNAIRWIKK